jgi:hypothetical protein
MWLLLGWSSYSGKALNLRHYLPLREKNAYSTKLEIEIKSAATCQKLPVTIASTKAEV